MPWYALRDHGRAPGEGMIEIGSADAQRWNDDGYGIFAAVNVFTGARRIANLKRIRGWYVDIDTGDKSEQVERIQTSPIAAFAVVETKRGYHVHWRADDTATADAYRRIERRLVEYFDGDKNATDLTRVLRVPGYYHRKDPADPFLVRCVYRDPAAVYSEAEMLRAFPPTSDELERERRKRRPLRSSGDSWWERLYETDQRVLLERLAAEGFTGESYDFRPCRNGTLTIVVDGEPTSCWIDEQGRIGSTSNGGPTVIQWLGWLGVPRDRAVDAVKQVAPELEMTA